MSIIPEKRIYAIEDIEKLPEGVHAELIDGEIYYMAAPTVFHQELSMAVSSAIYNYICSNKGKCRVFTAPFSVFLEGVENRHNYLEPDITVVCDAEKLDNGKGCSGAPDWIIEITSPSTASHDYLRKMRLYQMAGVKEYWIVSPEEKKVSVLLFAHTENPYKAYSFSEDIPVDIFQGFSINISSLL